MSDQCRIMSTRLCPRSLGTCEPGPCQRFEVKPTIEAEEVWREEIEETIQRYQILSEN